MNLISDPPRAPVPGGVRVTQPWTAATPSPKSTAAASGPRDRRDARIFQALLFFSLAVGIITLAVLLIQVFVEGWPRLNLDLLTNFPSRRPAAIRRSVGDLGHDLGHGDRDGALCRPGRDRRRHLPGGVRRPEALVQPPDRAQHPEPRRRCPSIVYGILGLAFFARGPFGLGRTVLAGGLTLSLLVLPDRHHRLAARPSARCRTSIREASLALGATQWQTVRRQVLPAAIPGIATGTILALSRAIGETAPLILLGALTFVTFNPDGLDQPVHRPARSRSSTGSRGPRRSSRCWPPRPSSCCWWSCWP